MTARLKKTTVDVHEADQVDVVVWAVVAVVDVEVVEVDHSATNAKATDTWLATAPPPIEGTKHASSKFSRNQVGY